MPTVYCLWFLLIWMVGGAGAQPASTETWAAVEQQVLPALLARQAAAEAQATVRARFRDGAASLDEAYPHLAPSLLGQPALLRGRIGELSEREVQRSLEAQAPPPAAELVEARRNRWAAAVQACHDAEARSDAAERTLLVGVLARLRAVPALTDPQIGPLRRDLEAIRDHATTLPDALDPTVRADAEQAAASADRALQDLEHWVRTLRLSGVRRSRVDVQSSLDALDDPAADRVSLWLQTASGRPADDARRALDTFFGARQQQDEAALASLRAELEGVTEPAEALPTLEATEALAIARMLAAESRVENATGSEVEQRARVARLARRRAEADLAETRRKIKAGIAQAQTAEATARLADEEAQAAAAAAGNDEDAARVAELKQQYANATERAAVLQREIAAVKERQDSELSSAIRSQASQVEILGRRLRFGEERPDPDPLHQQVLTSLDGARETARGALGHALEAREGEVETLQVVAADRRRIADANRWRETQGDDVSAQVGELLDAWTASLGSELDLAKRWVRAAHAAEQSALTQVQVARVTKRDLAPHLSRAERNVDANRFFEDLRKEADFLVPTVQFSVQQRWIELQNPILMIDSLQKVQALLAGFAWTIGAIVVWWWGRRRADRWALQFAKWVRQSRPEIRLSDVPALRDPTARAIRNVIDLLLGQVLLYSLGDALIEVQFLVRAYLYLAGYRALLAVFDLAVIPIGEVRPALLVLRKDTFALARRTVRWFLAYFVVSQLARWALWDVLQLDTLAGSVGSLLSGLFWVLVVWTLFRWEPFFREALARRRGAEHPVVRWLLPERGGVLLRIPRAVLQLALLAALFVLDTLQQVASEGTALGWFFNALNRAGLREPDAITFRPLSEDVKHAILEGDTPEKHLLDREELSAVQDAIDQWKETGLRGLVAVVGDRGMGKHTAMHEVNSMLTSSGLEVRRARLPGPMRTSSDLFAWLASVVGCEAAQSHEELVEALAQLEPRAVIIESVHRTFARRVGGLEVVQALFYVLNASSDRHFFVVTVHGPAWEYFAARGSMVDCGVFRTVVRLAPLTSQQLRKITLARAGEAGLRVDFSVLERQTALAGEPGTEEDRAITIFYRLLADASNGSPTAGLEIFTRCLEATDDPHLVRAHMAPALTVQPLTELPDDALFILVAIDLHDELELEELVEVTNLPLPVVRSTVRDLLSRGLLARDKTHLLIPDHQCPPVQLTLRRRHFLHLGGAA